MLALLVLFAAGPATAQSVYFEPATTYVTQLSPYSVAVGDFNNDGIPDLAIASNLFTSPNLTIYLGRGDGTFVFNGYSSAGSIPESVAVGNFNSDSSLDLVVADAQSGFVGILLGTGYGGFETGASYGAGTNPCCVTVGDVNGDGISDLAVTNYTTAGNVQVLLGNSNGTFQTAVPYAAGSYPESPVLANFNPGSALDLAVVNSGSTSDNVGVYLNEGNGIFGSPQYFSVGTYPVAAATGDFNGDGKADLAVVNFNDDTVSILLGNGDGTFQPQQIYATGTNPNSVAVADFNGDGKPDLAITNLNDNTVSVLLGNGDGTFQPQVTFGAGGTHTPGMPHSIVVSDFNKDGKPDLALADYGTSQVAILLNAMPATATMLSPSQGSTLPGSSVTFSWAAAFGAKGYWLDLGNTLGGNTYYQSGNLGGALSTTVNGLPTDGSMVYATLWWLENGQWVNNQYTYTAFSTSSSKGVITSPAPGSTLPGSTVTFSWSAGSGATAYWIDAGSTVGGNQYFQSGNIGNVTSYSVSGLPTNGSTVYVTLWSLVGGQWLNNQYTYTAFNQSGSQGVLTTPAPGSTLPGSTVTFGWMAGSGATAYWLDLGNVPSGNQYFQSGNLGNVTSVTVNGLPTNGSMVYATLYSMVGGQWLPNAYTYTAFNQQSSLGVMQVPTPGTIIYGGTQTFTWSAGSAASAYWLDIGSTQGGNQYYQSGNLGNVLSTTVNSLPADGSEIYVTLWSLVDGQWLNNQYTYFSATGSVIMSLVVNRSGAQATDGGGATLEAAIPQFLQYFTQGANYVALVSSASTSSVDVPITTQFITPIDTAIANMTFVGGNFGTGAGTNPLYSASYGPPLSMADYQNNSVSLPAGTPQSRAVVYFTDELMNAIQDQFSCTNLGATLYNYGGYDSPASQFDFFSPSNNNQSTNDLSSHYSGTTSGSGGCSNGTTGLCEGNPPLSASQRCLGVTTFYSQQYGEPEVFSRTNITAESQWRALYTANQMRSEAPNPTRVYVVGVGNNIANNEAAEAFFATLANDPNGPNEYPGAVYNPSLPAGEFFVVPACPSQVCTAAMESMFQIIASYLP